MNTVWSTYLQKIGLLYLTRQLKFDDRFKENYIRIFNIENAGNILEIGAGPGALTQALHRWYPNANVIGSDRDTNFVEFAKTQAPYIEFVEADITSLPFGDDSFDVTISNTVQEHVAPNSFFGEQYRVLKPGGVCLVLSGRGHRAIQYAGEISDFEKEMWQNNKNDYDEKYGVSKYGVSEQELPAIMSRYGFKDIQTHYVTTNLTPDSAQYDEEFALKIFEANRRVELDSIDSKNKEWVDAVNNRYDKRIAQYKQGIKLWDTNVSLTMIVRGVK
ncbi:MAG: class I SAM-dependent methyltransferase [Oscillospiraceae bacterium]|nr:class I SAM-dependent methyltransferase [Oscillospiraceae bacterium]